MTIAALFPELSRWLQESQLFPIVILIVALLLLMSSMRRRQQAMRKPPTPKPSPESSTSTHALRRDLDDLLVELQDLSRRITAEIDTRFAKLEAAMRDADRRI